MAVLFPLEIYTPERLFYSDSIEGIILTLTDGEVAVYGSHSPFTAPVVPCLLKIRDRNGEWKTAFAAEGILEVNSRKTILLLDAAEWPGEIDRERALAAKAKAEEVIENKMFKFETETAKAALRRANMRIMAVQ